LAGIDAVRIAAGKNHGMVLKKDGTVWSWGKNESAQLGNGTTVNQLNPMEVQFSSK